MIIAFLFRFFKALMMENEASPSKRKKTLSLLEDVKYLEPAGFEPGVTCRQTTKPYLDILGPKDNWNQKVIGAKGQKTTLKAQNGSHTHLLIRNLVNCLTKVIHSTSFNHLCPGL